jgi:hypothetical protein
MFTIESPTIPESNKRQRLCHQNFDGIPVASILSLELIKMGILK